MIDKEKVIGGLELLAHWPDGLIITDKEKWIKPCCEMAIALLKEQEESIPVSWLKEKLEGHPELPYAVTDGINNVLDLWKGR